MWVVFLPSCSVCYYMEICPISLRFMNNVSSTYHFLEIQQNLDLLIAFFWVCNTIMKVSPLYTSLMSPHWFPGREQGKCAYNVGHLELAVPEALLHGLLIRPSDPTSFPFPSLCLVAFLLCYAAVLFPASMRSLHIDLLHVHFLTVSSLVLVPLTNNSVCQSVSDVGQHLSKTVPSWQTFWQI